MQIQISSNMSFTLFYLVFIIDLGEDKESISGVLCTKMFKGTEMSIFPKEMREGELFYILKNYAIECKFTWFLIKTE